MLGGPARGIAAGAALIAIMLAGAALARPVFASPPIGGHVPPPRGADGKLTARQLAADLRSGVNTQRVPSNLRPSLAAAPHDYTLISKNGCELTLVPVWSKPCVFGDTSSQTSVVLFGDSHAGVWFPALNAITRRHHWRLVIFTKDACPAEAVNVVRRGHAYPQCPIWRRNAEQQIAALHPALVVVASLQYITVNGRQPPPVNGMRPLAGVPTGHGGPWQNGVAATFSFLHQAAQRTLYITDVPILNQAAPRCLSAHLADVPACTVSTRVGFRHPRLTADELKLAKQAHIDSVNDSSWFCTPTRCPVIVGNIELYRDSQHMDPEWSSFLSPILDHVVTRVMSAPPATATSTAPTPRTGFGSGVG
ncbi:MAG TPA: SGNH hydrolase domain-containing protein [Solirubrobacteraceae bacterium]|nr:SGNH hydrolase domain-containing protein [Solirubrobacteraceae bacterium]